MNNIENLESHRAVKNLEHRDAVLKKELDLIIEEYRAVAGKFFSAAAVNDLRLHYRSMNRLPELIQMFLEEIEIIKREGRPRENPWWNLVDELY